MTACNVCRQDKPRESFSADRRRKDGLQARCKSCAAEIAKKWRLENQERVTAVRRDWEKRNPERHLLTKFGIRADEKRAIFEAQGSVCGACGSGHHGHPRIEGETGWCLDHCHASGKIRGVLCWRCNLALGYAGDSPDALRALAAYIESHHGVNAARNIARFGLESLAVGAPA